MASSGVEFYERQKALQEILRESEQERMQLERKFQTWCKKGRRVEAKLKAAKLQSYWKKLCEEEKRSKERNENLLKKFSSIDFHISALSTLSSQLKKLKGEFENYIQREYPNWHHRVLKQQEQLTVGVLSQQQTNLGNLAGSSNYKIQNDHDSSNLSRSVKAYDQQQGEISSERITLEDLSGQHPKDKDFKMATTFQHPDQSSSFPNITVHSQQRVSVPAVTPNKQLESFTHLREISSVSQANPAKWNTQVKPGNSGLRFEQPTGGRGTLKSDVETWLDSQEDLGNEESSKSDQATDKMKLLDSTLVPQLSLPVESLSVGELKGGGMKQMFSDFSDKNQQASDHFPRKTTHAPNFDDKEDDPLEDYNSDFSEFESDTDTENQPKVQEDVLQKSLRRSVSPINPELSVDGLLHLMTGLQRDFVCGSSKNAYYTRSYLPTSLERKDILLHFTCIKDACLFCLDSKANQGSSLDGIDASLISRVILEQLTIIVRSQPAHCLLPDQLLFSATDPVSESFVKSQIPVEGQALWTHLFDHLTHLRVNKVMSSKEIAAVFVPCLLEDGSCYEDKAFKLLVSLMESTVGDNSLDILSEKPLSKEQHKTDCVVDGTDPVVEDREKIESQRRLADSIARVFSDEDEEEDKSFFDQEIPAEREFPVALNEMEAYRTMVSDVMATRVSEDDEINDDSDDDLENHFISTLPNDGSASANRRSNYKGLCVESSLESDVDVPKSGVFSFSEKDDFEFYD